MPRETIEVTALVSYINGMLAAPSTTEDTQAALCQLAEYVLHKSDRYNGFAYVEKGTGHPVGHRAVQEGRYEEHRRMYFLVPRKPRKM